jgi:putative transposase
MQATGRSRGGLTTKIHLSSDERGRIKHIVLTGGQTADVKMALDLVQGLKPNKVIADKAYDADWLLHYLDSEGMEAVIPPKANRLQQRQIDRKAYQQRNVIERTINRLKQYRRIATRYEKTAISFISLCFLAATLINMAL